MDVGEVVDEVEEEDGEVDIAVWDAGGGAIGSFLPPDNLSFAVSVFWGSLGLSSELLTCFMGDPG